MYRFPSLITLPQCPACCMTSPKFTPVPATELEEQQEKSFLTGQPPSTENTSFREKSFFQRCGWTATLTLPLSLLAIVASLVVLCWVWFSSHSDDTWRSLILTGWLPRTVALCSLVIRWSVSALAAIATSMLAAIAIERHGVLLEQLAKVSIVRHTNTGPMSLGSLLKRSPTRRIFVRLAIGVLILTTALLQFTSTVLLSDLDTASLPGAMNSSSINMTFPNRQSYQSFPPIQDALPYFTSENPSTFPTFAEFSKPRLSNDASSDTGVTYRAFFPINQQSTRETLLSYSGRATVIDARVVCFAPRFINPGFSKDATSQDPSKYTFGSLVAPNVDQSILKDPDLVLRPVTDGIQADSIDLIPPNSTLPEKVTVIQRLPNAACGLQSLLTPGAFPSVCGINATYANSQRIDPINHGKSSLPLTNATVFDKSNATLGNAWIVYTNVTAVNSDLKNPERGSGIFLGIDNGAEDSSQESQVDNGGFNTTWASIAISNRSSWSDVSIAYNGTSSFLFSASICYDALGFSRDLDIEASRNEGAAEPTMNYIGTNLYDTSSVRAQLGALPGSVSPSPRNILNLNDPTPAATDTYTLRDVKPFRVDPFGPLTSSSPPVIRLPVCKYCQPVYTGSNEQSAAAARNTTVQVLQDIIDTTGNPALLIQAFITQAFRASYAASIPFFADAAAVTTQQTAQILIPVQWRGLAAVVVVLAVHVAVVSVVVGLFATRTRVSVVRSAAWQAVAQASSSQALSEEMREMAEASATDKELEKVLRKRGRAGDRVMLEDNAGRVDVTVLELHELVKRKTK